MTAMKLQKLVYYCQAWALVWDSAPLFEERIEAWANGPVVPELYEAHRGQFEVDASTLDIVGDASKLSAEQARTVDAVLDFYGDKTPHWLSSLTHAERPWLEARSGLRPGEFSKRLITHASMAEFYSSLT